MSCAADVQRHYEYRGSIDRDGPIEKVYEGLKVVDMNGEKVGKVEFVKLGDPQGISIQGEDPDVWPDVPRPFAVPLLLTGYLKVDHTGRFARDAHVSASEVEAVEDNTVRLDVSKDTLLTKRTGGIARAVAHERPPPLHGRRQSRAFANVLASRSQPCHGEGGTRRGKRHAAKPEGESIRMRCERCRAEATSTGPGGQRLCDKHYNPTMAAAPGMVGTGTAADAVGAFIVAKGVGSQVHGGHVPVLRHQSLWQRVRQRFAR